MGNLQFSLLAYLDPLSGSIIIQVLIATIVAIAFFFKRSWQRIRDAVVRVFHRNTSTTEK